MGFGNCSCRWCWISCCTNCKGSVVVIVCIFEIKRKKKSSPSSNSYAALGANVIAAAGSPQKMEIAKRLGGADHVINYSKPGWQKEVLALTNERGVDIIYDPVGLINGKIRFSIAFTDRTEIKKIAPMISNRFFEMYCLERTCRRSRFCCWYHRKG
jgi:Zinc-binding dehydrogenase